MVITLASAEREEAHRFLASMGLYLRWNHIFRMVGGSDPLTRGEVLAVQTLWDAEWERLKPIAEARIEAEKQANTLAEIAAQPPALGAAEGELPLLDVERSRLKRLRLKMDELGRIRRGAHGGGERDPIAPERVMDDGLNDAEQRILLWLLDQNPIQRVIRKTAAGKTDVVAEHDLSGGLNAFMNLLGSDAPISRRIRDALRRVFDPMGLSILHLAKRPRRARGRPDTDDTLRGFLRHEYDVLVHPEKTAKAEEKVKKRRIRATGTHTKKVTVDEKILELEVSRSEHYRRLGAAKRLKQKKKQFP